MLMTDSQQAHKPALPRALSAAEKVGLLLLALGKERASELLKKFDSEELNMIMRSTDAMPTISALELASIVDEFENRLGQGPPFVGRADDVKLILAGVIRDNRSAADALDGVGSKEELWTRLPLLKDEVIIPFLDKLHPQISAFILFKVGGERATEVLRNVPAEVRNELLTRILGMRDVSLMIIDALEESIHQELFEVDKGASTRHITMASILNSLDRVQSAEALDHLAGSRPKDAEAIKKMLFKFEDLIKLSPKALTALMDGVPVERTVIALQGMDPAFQTTVLATLSPRARRMAEAELQGGTNASARDLAESRRAIVESVLKLTADGTIELPAAGSDTR